ncbi:MAG: PKD domain-containing protein, partial [Bacteroidales bacterium]|nr:PKD domain-containing protein [Bacteroidales bacterium]
VSRSWKISVTSSGRLFDDFEAETIGPWFNLNENQPGIHLVENPDKTGINDSAQCLCDEVNGSGGTSGYFTMKAAQMLSQAGFDVSEYSGIRFMVHLNGNKYYPRIDYGGTKYPSVTPPKFQGEWEVLEYRLPEGTFFDNTKNITFRMMYNEAGSNVSGRDDATNNRKVYIDNIEFFK